MRRALLAMAVALATMGLSAAPATAATVCGQDGVGAICANTAPGTDQVQIQYQVTQSDGPGTYSVYYVDTTTGTTSPADTVGPLTYQNVVTGTQFGHLGHCFNVHMDSAPGTSLVVGPIC